MRWSLSYFIVLIFPLWAFANVTTLVFDTGAGLATITRFPDGRIMVYDTGHWDQDNRIFEAFQQFIGDADIDLLIASHSDSDHIAATDELFNTFTVHRVIRTGFERERQTWRDHDDAIQAAASVGMTHDINLKNVTLPHGTVYRFGAARVTYLSGFHESPSAWGLTGSEFRNGNSIVMRLEYQGHSILFTGDAVGREEQSPPTASAIATEKYLIDNQEVRPIDSDVLIAPHHGSDDASSQEFIRAVSPRWVIFSAGHDHGHPKQVTANRYLALGLQAPCLLRTDRGDDEGTSEWNHGRQPNHIDPVGDDSIEIILASDGTDPIVRYLGEAGIDCPQVDFQSGATVAGTEVRRSRSGICHTSQSRFYNRLTIFESFADLATCLASGGRELRR